MGCSFLSVCMNAFTRQLEYAADVYSAKLGFDLREPLILLCVKNKVAARPRKLLALARRARHAAPPATPPTCGRDDVGRVSESCASTIYRATSTRTGYTRCGTTTTRRYWSAWRRWSAVGLPNRRTPSPRMSAPAHTAGGGEAARVDSVQYDATGPHTLYVHRRGAAGRQLSMVAEPSVVPTPPPAAL